MAASCFGVAPLTFALPYNIKYRMTTTVFAAEAVLFSVYAAMTFVVVLRMLSPELQRSIVFIKQQVLDTLYLICNNQPRINENQFSCLFRQLFKGALLWMQNVQRTLNCTTLFGFLGWKTQSRLWYSVCFVSGVYSCHICLFLALPLMGYILLYITPSSVPFLKTNYFVCFSDHGFCSCYICMEILSRRYRKVESSGIKN